jgi:hypothetical protein
MNTRIDDDEVDCDPLFMDLRATPPAPSQAIALLKM